MYENGAAFVTALFAGAKQNDCCIKSALGFCLLAISVN